MSEHEKSLNIVNKKTFSKRDDATAFTTSTKKNLCPTNNCRNNMQHLIKCPLDSIEEVLGACVCTECGDVNDMNKWCKQAGENFEATLIEKGQKIPGKCCDLHICRKYLSS